MPVIFAKEKLGKNRVNGFYETPLLTVQYMVSKIVKLWKPGMTILDPAVGDGVFLYELKKTGIPECNIFGFDIDHKKIDTLKDDFSNLKVFDSTNPFEQHYDFIIGNPPYNGDESYFIRENRERLQKLFTEIGAKNTYSMISYQAIKSLKPNGTYCMILSDSFLTNIYYKKFRAFLLQNTIIEEILLAPRKLFYNNSADVRTCILTLRKKNAVTALSKDLPLFNKSDTNIVKLIDRVSSEAEYKNPELIEYVQQNDFESYPQAAFLIGVPKEIRDLYLNPPLRLGDIVEGGTGISTGNDKKFLKKMSEVKNDPVWVPYYKNGARRAYWYIPEYYIEKDYKKYSENISNYLIRNEQYFFKEGFTCSSVGVRFSAAFMPRGGLFGVNANFFTKDKKKMFYLLGILNSKLGWYFARRVLVRTNNISANYLRLLPLVNTKDDEQEQLITIVEKIIAELRKNEQYDYSSEQKKIDELVFKIYDLGQNSKDKILDFCNNFYDQL